MVTIKVNNKQLKDLQRTLQDIPRKMPLVISRSLNRTIVKAKTETSREIGKEIRLKQTDIKKKITVKKASRSHWTAIMKLSKSRVPLIKFAARQVKRGVTYAISRKGGRSRRSMGFIEKMPRGHRGVFRRHKPATPRLPIVELFGPSVAGVFQGGKLNRLIGSSKMSRKIKKLIQTNLVKNLTEQIDYVLKKRGT